MISGVVVVCAPERMEELKGTLEAYEWIDVHHTDSVGRMVVTLEAADADQSVERLREIQQLPHVVMAEMAEYVDEA